MHTYPPTHTHTCKTGAVMAHTLWVEALQTSNCQCLHHCKSNVGSGGAQSILHFFWKRGDEVREQAPYSYRQSRTDWFVYHQYLQMSIWAPLRKWIFSAWSRMFREIIGISAAADRGRDRNIYRERQMQYTRRCTCAPENITARQTRKTDRLSRRDFELPNNIPKAFVVSKMTDSECFCVACWKHASRISNLICKAFFKWKTKSETVKQQKWKGRFWTTH